MSPVSISIKFQISVFDIWPCIFACDLNIGSNSKQQHGVPDNSFIDFLTVALNAPPKLL